MKSSKLFLSLAALPLFVLAACQGASITDPAGQPERAAGEYYVGMPCDPEVQPPAPWQCTPDEGSLAGGLITIA